LTAVVRIEIRGTAGAFYVAVICNDANIRTSYPGVTYQTPTVATKAEAERTAEQIAHGLYWETP
jgi:hypothetical protein